MTSLDFVSLPMSLWFGLTRILNSSFISSFFSALAGAGFGVWGAQKLAERSILIEELSEGLRQSNAIIILSSTIANQALSLKKQHVAPMLDRYFKDREAAKAINERLLSGRVPGKQPVFSMELKKITSLTLPMDALKSLAYSGQLMPGRALALVSMIEQSATELAATISIRSELIDDFHSYQPPSEIFCQDYFGLQRRDGNTNAMYHDIMVAMSQYTDDVAFFSAQLAEDLEAYASRVRDKLLKFRRDTAKPSFVDFSESRKSGLMPPAEDYKSWLSGFKHQD